MPESHNQASRYHGGLSLLDMLLSLAIIALILSLTTTNAGGIISAAKQVADNANARQVFTFAGSRFISEASGLSQLVGSAPNGETLKVYYSGLSDVCNTPLGTTSADTLKREIINHVPSLKEKGFCLYITQDAGGRYQIFKVAVFSEHPEKAMGDETVQPTGSYPIGA